MKAQNKSNIPLADQISELHDRILSLEKELSTQKQAQNSLAISEKNLSAILEQNADGILIVDTKGIVLYVNPAAELLFNTKKEDFLGSMFGFPVSTDNTDCSLVIKIGNILREVEFRVVQIVWQGHSAFQLSVRDITKLKQVEDELINAKEKAEESKKEFQQLAESMPQIVWITDSEGLNTYFNQQWVDYTGLSLEESYGTGWNKPFHPDDKKRAWDAWQNAVTNNGTYSLECRLRHKDGDYFWWLIRGVPVFDLEGNIVKWFGTCTDIQKIKKAEAEIIEAKNYAEENAGKLKAALNSMSDAVFISDLDGNFINYNEAFATFHKFKNKHECAKTLKEYPVFLDVFYTNGEIVPIEMWVVSRALRGEIGLSEEYILKRKDTDESWVGSYSYSPIRSNEGEIIGSVVIARDITELKKAEKELINAKEKAEESDRLKTSFLNNISHEIRTPMNAIVGFSGLLNKPDLDAEKRQQYIDLVVRSSNHLLFIIDDIVRIASIDAGQEKIQKDEVNINSICKLLFEQFRSRDTIQNVELSYNTPLDNNDAMIITDGIKLTQILTNLIGNALKFTHKGYVNFGYEIKNNNLEFYVKDSGIGISPEMHEEIFKRFRQVEITIERQYGGSGLGLSISKAYIELLGGKIWLSSELDKGSTFYFSLPYNKVKQEKLPKFKSYDESNINLENLHTILIAEDNNINYLLLEEIFSSIDIKINRATNGIEAIEICKSTQIDLVLMDIKMPKMDGYEASRRIKEFKPDLKIIAQTAYSSEEDRKKAYACGICDFISKPINQELLFSKINEQLK